MITRVNFSAYVQVTKGGLSCPEWRPGRNGIVEILRDAGGYLDFRLEDGTRAIVYPPPGTVVTCDDGPTTSPAVDTPAPALPIKPRR